MLKKWQESTKLSWKSNIITTKSWYIYIFVHPYAYSIKCQINTSLTLLDFCPSNFILYLKSVFVLEEITASGLSLEQLLQGFNSLSSFSNSWFLVFSLLSLSLSIFISLSATWLWAEFQVFSHNLVDLLKCIKTILKKKSFSRKFKHKILCITSPSIFHYSASRHSIQL